MQEPQNTDESAQAIEAEPSTLISASSIDRIRSLIALNQAAVALPENDIEAINALGMLQNGKLTLASLLLVGSGQAIERSVPGYGWRYQYAPFNNVVIEDWRETSSLVESVESLTALVGDHSPVFVTQRKDQRAEIRVYPIVALQQALWNAFAHQDLSLRREILVHQTTDYVHIISPGSLSADITPENILRAPRRYRNHALMKILSLMGLAKQPVPGIEQMTWAMLAEGREAPIISSNDSSVQVSLTGGASFELWPIFIEEEIELGRPLNIYHLLLLRHLLLNIEVDRVSAAIICQCSEDEVFHLLSDMTSWGYLRYNPTSVDEFWAMQSELFRRLSSNRALIRQRQLYRMTLYSQMYALLLQAARQGQEGMANAEIRRLMRLRLNHVPPFMRDMMKTYPDVEMLDRGRSSVYRLKPR